MNTTKSAEVPHVPVVLSASDRPVTEVSELKDEIQRLTARMAEMETNSRRELADRDSKMNGLLIKLVELEPYPAKYRELETKFRVTLAERDARILELEKRFAAFESQTLDDPATRRPRASEPGRDDLKAIRGIGDQLESLLNTLGIRWYRQIAGWTPEDVSFYSSKLDHFPGRIDREHWVARARELHERKYGEKL